MQESKIALVCKQTHFKAKFGLSQKSQNNYLECVAVSHRVGRESGDANNGAARWRLRTPRHATSPPTARGATAR